MYSCEFTWLMRRLLEALLRLFVVVEHLLQRQQVLRSLRLQRRDALLKLPFLLRAFSLPVLKRLRASLLLPRPFLPDRILILLVLALELLLFLSGALRSLLRVLGILRSLGVLLRELFLPKLLWIPHIYQRIYNSPKHFSSRLVLKSSKIILYKIKHKIITEIFFSESLRGIFFKDSRTYLW